MAERPKVFISSTIYDFRDLRSSLKFWLEELGFDVLLSEHNDFPVQVDLNSYETCLNSIDGCDYLIVLVGGRVGGWYDRTNRVSITQAEYRRGYGRLLAGRIKVLAFVRQDIWDVRQDRNELERLLRNEALLGAELGEEDIAKITQHASKFANDAEFTFQFLSEIARIEEMKTAMEGKSPFPIGNWIRQFRDFRDIAEALHVEFKIGVSLRRVALSANLCAEIESNLQVLMDQNDGHAEPKYTSASYTRDKLAGGFRDNSEIPGKYLKCLVIFALSACNLGRKLSTAALDEAITSGEFLDFDQTADAFVVGALHQALLDLKRHIQRLCHNDELMDIAKRIDISDQFKGIDDDDVVSVANLKLLPILSIHDSQFNVVEMHKAIFWAVHGDLAPLKALRPYADSPLEEENKNMERERPTREQIAKWLAE